LANAISEKLTSNSDTIIRISGCPNSCGHHYIADIGFQGKAKRVDGKLMPFYDVLLGGRTVEGDAHLAERIGTVPAKRIPDLLAEALGSGGNAQEQIRTLVGSYSDISPSSLSEDYYYDYGATEPFSLAGIGPGECGAGVMDVIKLDLDEANEAVEAVKKTVTDAEKSKCVYKAIVAAARSLLVTFGLEPKKDREIFAAFSKHLIEPGWVKSETKQLVDNAMDWRLGDRASIDDLAMEVEDLVNRVKELFLSLDANLKFKIPTVTGNENIEARKSENRVIDLRGVACPLNFVKAKLELEKTEVGHVLEVLLDDGEPVRNVPQSFADQGQEVLGAKSVGDHYCVTVRRKK
jgi:sulfite reductase (ferredoxin)